MTESPPRVRLEFLDGVRAAAALYVVLHHAFLTVYPHGDPTGAAAWTFSWLRYGTLGVAIFIVVSGYSLMIRPARVGGLGEPYWSFIRRRFRRIILPYWIALAVSIALALTVLSRRTGTHWDVSVPVTPLAVLVHVLGLQDIAYSASINHVFWSVALEWHIYFVFPLLLWIWARVGRVGSTAAVLVITVGVAVLAGRSGVTAPLLEFANFLGLFAVGALCCVVSSGRIGSRIDPIWWAAGAAVLLVATICSLILVGSTTLATTLIGLTAGSGLIAMANGRLTTLRRFFQWRPVVWLGTISFSLYLLHALVVQLVWQYALVPFGSDLEDGPSLAVLLPVSAVLSVLVAWGFWFVGERPFLSSLHKRRVELEQAKPRT